MRTFLFTLCAAAVALTASAQSPVLQSGPPVLLQPPSRLDILTEYLSLTSSQQAQAKTIFDAEDAATKPALTALQQAQSALNGAAKRGESDSTLDNLAVTVGTCFANLAAIHARAEKAVLRHPDSGPAGEVR